MRKRRRSRKHRIAILASFTLLFYLASYVVWVQIAVERSERDGLVGYYFLPPEAASARIAHVVCVNVYCPLIWFDQRFVTGRTPAKYFPLISVEE